MTGVLSRYISICSFVVALRLAGTPVSAGGKKVSREPLASVRITIRVPGWAPQDIDAILWPQAVPKFAAKKTIGGFSLVSTFGQADFYVYGRGTSPVADIARDSLNVLCHLLPLLPRNSVPSFSAMGDIEIPQVKIAEVRYLEVSVDRKKMARFGLTIRAVQRAIKAGGIDLEKRPMTAEKIAVSRKKMIEALYKTTIQNRDGTSVRLSEFVNVEISKTQSHIIHKWPSPRRAAN